MTFLISVRCSALAVDMKDTYSFINVSVYLVLDYMAFLLGLAIELILLCQKSRVQSSVETYILLSTYIG